VAALPDAAAVLVHDDQRTVLVELQVLTAVTASLGVSGARGKEHAASCAIDHEVAVVLPAQRGAALMGVARPHRRRRPRLAVEHQVAVVLPHQGVGADCQHGQGSRGPAAIARWAAGATDESARRAGRLPRGGGAWGHVVVEILERPGIDHVGLGLRHLSHDLAEQRIAVRRTGCDQLAAEPVVGALAVEVGQRELGVQALAKNLVIGWLHAQVEGLVGCHIGLRRHLCGSAERAIAIGARGRRRA
jgi:hypothetical protein